MIHSFTKTLPLIAILAMLTGCRMNEAVYHPDGSRIVYMRPPLMNVVDELEMRHKSAQTVFARLNVTLHDQTKNKDFNLVGVYLGDKVGNMRLRINATTGQLVLDMGLHDNTIDVWLPRKDRFFQGKREDLLSNTQCQLSLLAYLGSACDVLFPYPWTKDAVERRVTYEHGREIISVIEKPGFLRRRARRLTIAPENAAVESLDIFDKVGHDVGTVSYSDYRYPERPGDEEIPLGGLTGMVYPGKISLKSANGVQSLDLEVDEITINPPISLDKFSVPLPENMKIKDLGSALKQHANLWE